MMMGVTITLQKKNDQLVIHYISDLAFSTIYWSITLLLICLVVIISLEVGKPTVWSVLCGIIAIVAIIIAYKQRVIITPTDVIITSSFKKYNQTYALSEVHLALHNHTLRIRTNNKTIRLFVFNKTSQKILSFVNRYHIKLDRA